MRYLYQDHPNFGLSVFATMTLFIGVVVLFQQYEANVLDLVREEATLSVLLFVGVFALSIVAVPVSAVPLIALGVQVWGVWVTVLLSVVGWTWGAVMAFWIARYFGEPLVRHLLSEDIRFQIEHYVTHHRIFWTIAVLRAILPFDGLSYVLGLIPHVRFGTFLAATVIGLVPFCVTMAYLGTLPLSYLLTGAGLLVVLVGLYVFTHRNHRLKKY